MKLRIESVPGDAGHESCTTAVRAGKGTGVGARWAWGRQQTRAGLTPPHAASPHPTPSPHPPHTHRRTSTRPTPAAHLAHRAARGGRLLHRRVGDVVAASVAGAREDVGQASPVAHLVRQRAAGRVQLKGASREGAVVQERGVPQQEAKCGGRGAAAGRHDSPQLADDDVERRQRARRDGGADGIARGGTGVDPRLVFVPGRARRAEGQPRTRVVCTQGGWGGRRRGWHKRAAQAGRANPAKRQPQGGAGWRVVRRRCCATARLPLPAFSTAS